MKEILAEIKFDISGVNGKWLQQRFRKQFEKQRSLLVDILNNGIIDMLNEEFERTYGKYDNYDFPEYNKFMQDGQQKWADIVNKHSDCDVDLMIDEYNDIYGVQKKEKFKNPGEIHMTIKPIKEL